MDAGRWFGAYLDAFAACGRGEHPPSSLLAFYGVPLLVSTDDGCTALTTSDEVLAMAQRQVEGMLAAGYDHSDVVDLDVASLNAFTALVRGSFSRRRHDGDEIGRLTVTYLVTGAAQDRRISTLTVHAP